MVTGSDTTRAALLATLQEVLTVFDKLTESAVLAGLGPMHAGVMAGLAIQRERLRAGGSSEQLLAALNSLAAECEAIALVVSQIA